VNSKYVLLNNSLIHFHYIQERNYRVR